MQHIWYANRCVAVAACILILLFSRTALAQSGENSPIQYRNTVSVGLSAGRVPGNDGAASSEIGADWLYRWNPKWETGIQLDLGFEQGYGAFESYTLVTIVSYTITDRVPFFFGVGFEHSKESGDNEFVVRVGTEYTFYLSADQRIMLIPGAFVDRVAGETNVSLALAIGYTF